MPNKYTPELCERAVRMVLERHVAEGGPRSHSIRAEAPQLGVGEEALRMWCSRHGHEILKAASAFSPGSLEKPHDEMIAFIDEHRDQFGVEAICRALGATARGFITST